MRSDEAEARALGITGVPFFMIDRHFGISGAQSPDSILHVLDQAWADTHPGFVLSTDEGDELRRRELFAPVLTQRE